MSLSLSLSLAASSQESGVKSQESGVSSQESAIRRGSREAEASMEAIFAAIYSVWCSWVEFLLLFVAFGAKVPSNLQLDHVFLKVRSIFVHLYSVW